MAILTTQKDLLIANKGNEKRQLRVKLTLEAQRIIRRSFDKATFDHEALAAIDIAKEYGFTALAEELQSDYDSLIDTNQEAA